MHISEIRAGGQTGADRGAFAAARELGVTISGWCPEGGWAEDLPEPPGLLALFPEMEETPGDGGTQTRTEWNIRDSDYCIVLSESGTSSPGTDYGMAFFDKYSVPFIELPISTVALADAEELDDVAGEVLSDISSKCDIPGFVLGVGGPRASENGLAFEAARKLTKAVIELDKGF